MDGNDASKDLLSGSPEAQSEILPTLVQRLQADFANDPSALEYIQHVNSPKYEYEGVEYNAEQLLLEVWQQQDKLDLEESFIRTVGLVLLRCFSKLPHFNTEEFEDELRTDFKTAGFEVQQEVWVLLVKGEDQKLCRIFAHIFEEEVLRQPYFQRMGWAVLSHVLLSFYAQRELASDDFKAEILWVYRNYLNLNTELLLALENDYHGVAIARLPEGIDLQKILSLFLNRHSQIEQIRDFANSNLTLGSSGPWGFESKPDKQEMQAELHASQLDYRDLDQVVAFLQNYFGILDIDWRFNDRGEYSEKMRDSILEEAEGLLELTSSSELPVGIRETLYTFYIKASSLGSPFRVVLNDIMSLGVNEVNPLLRQIALAVWSHHLPLEGQSIYIIFNLLDQEQPLPPDLVLSLSRVFLFRALGIIPRMYQSLGGKDFLEFGPKVIKSDSATLANSFFLRIIESCLTVGKGDYIYPDIAVQRAVQYVETMREIGKYDQGGKAILPYSRSFFSGDAFRTGPLRSILEQRQADIEALIQEKGGYDRLKERLAKRLGYEITALEPWS